MINDRLKEERVRLGFTQPVFAELAGTKKRTLIDWEKGASSPTAVQLSALAKVGVDVLYVLTGQRNSSVLVPEPVLSPEKQVLLDAFDEMTPEQRRAILEVGRVLSQPKSGKQTG